MKNILNKKLKQLTFDFDNLPAQQSNYINPNLPSQDNIKYLKLDATFYKIYPDDSISITTPDYKKTISTLVKKDIADQIYNQLNIQNPKQVYNDFDKFVIGVNQANYKTKIQEYEKLKENIQNNNMPNNYPTLSNLYDKMQHILLYELENTIIQPQKDEYARSKYTELIELDKQRTELKTDTDERREQEHPSERSTRNIRESDIIARINPRSNQHNDRINPRKNKSLRIFIKQIDEAKTNKELKQLHYKITDSYIFNKSIDINECQYLKDQIQIKRFDLNELSPIENFYDKFSDESLQKIQKVANDILNRDIFYVGNHNISLAYDQNKNDYFFNYQSPKYKCGELDEEKHLIIATIDASNLEIKQTIYQEVQDILEDTFYLQQSNNQEYEEFNYSKNSLKDQLNKNNTTPQTQK